MNTKDALGNQIIVGNKYGCCIHRNGHAKTIVGIVEKFNPTGACVRVEKVTHALYLGEPVDANLYGKETITIKCVTLFPVFEREPQFIG